MRSRRQYLGNPTMTHSPRRPTLIVAGTGRAGGALVEELLQRAPDRFQIRMFGGEPSPDRILVSGVVDGGDPGTLQLLPASWFEERGILVHSGIKLDRIDCRQRLAI